MVWFDRKKKRPPKRSGAHSHYDATSGSSFRYTPDEKQFIQSEFERALQYVKDKGLKPGDTFIHKLESTSIGIAGPSKIMFGMMKRDHEYGLYIGGTAEDVMSITIIEHRNPQPQ